MILRPRLRLRASRTTWGGEGEAGDVDTPYDESFPPLRTINIIGEHPTPYPL